MGHRHRNMYYATGLPGWMRFGYSPGWGGMPPGATYLTTGRWPTPQMEAAWQSGWGQMGPAGQGYTGSPEQELDLLRNQASMLEDQLNQILKRIDDIGKAEEK